MADGHNVLHFTLRAQPDAPAALRERLREVDQLADALRPDLELLVSELITNAIRHSGLGPADPIHVRIRIDPARVRAEVRDEGHGLPKRIRRPVDPPVKGSTSGYGLYLVDRIASRWGARRDHGTTVWFELLKDRSPKDAAGIEPARPA
jgi:signal transduction histidine kinase